MSTLLSQFDDEWQSIIRKYAGRYDSRCQSSEIELPSIPFEQFHLEHPKAEQSVWLALLVELLTIYINHRYLDEKKEPSVRVPTLRQLQLDDHKIAKEIAQAYSSIDSNFRLPERIGDYSIVESLKKSGQAQIVIGLKPEPNATHKVLKFVPPGTPDATQTHNEGVILQGLQQQGSHPNIITLIDHKTDVIFQYEFLVLERLFGESLQDVTDLSDVEIAFIGEAIASALAHAHRHGILHLDLSEGNIVLEETPNSEFRFKPVLLDFGYAVRRENGNWPKLNVDWKGGTKKFMAPEQRETTLEERTVDERTDLFQLGGVLGYQRNKVYPIDDESFRTSIRNSTMPPMLRDGILKATAFHPMDRFQTATEMQEWFRKAHLEAIRLERRRLKSKKAVFIVIGVILAVWVFTIAAQNLPIKDRSTASGEKSGVPNAQSVSDSPAENEGRPPFLGGATIIEEPSKVEISDELVVAASVQDAMKSASRANIDSFEFADNSNEAISGIGARWIRFPSGVGVVATGQAVYVLENNPTTSRIRKRNAYVIAYTNAKAAMARHLSTITNDGRTILKTASELIDSSSSKQTNSTDQIDELIQQAAQALLSGYVTYSIQEVTSKTDGDISFVFVSIVSTPQTQNGIVRNGAIQSAGDLESGVQHVMDELKSEIIPPVGGRVIVVPETGGIAVTAFGTAIIQDHTNPTLAAKSQLNAQKVSGVRARDALAGMMNGDKTIWSIGAASNVSQEFEESTRYEQENSPFAKNGQLQATVSDFRDNLLSSETIQEEIQSIRSGVLPPGIQEKTWLDVQGEWAYSVVIYYPPVSEQAKSFIKKMRSAAATVPIMPQDESSGVEKERVKPLKGGQVSPDNQL